MSEILALPYIATITSKKSRTSICALGVFINKHNVITTRERAMEIDAMKKNYSVHSSPILGSKKYAINSAFYSENDDAVVALSYGILKVS